MCMTYLKWSRDSHLIFNLDYLYTDIWLRFKVSVSYDKDFSLDKFPINKILYK